MFGFSGEHLLVLLVILLIFGPKRLPDLGHSLGRTLKNFKDAMGGNHLDSAGSQPVPPAPQIPTATPASSAANREPSKTPEQQTEQV